jgi:hypothetical protein
MAQPSNSVMGTSDSTIFSIPEPVIDTSDEKSTAKFARSKLWKQQKEYLQSRIDYWQHFLPSGEPINTLPQEQRETAWIIADNVIREINQWILGVEGIEDGVRQTEA